MNTCCCLKGILNQRCLVNLLIQHVIKAIVAMNAVIIKF